MVENQPVALITGASRGLGAAFAETLCATHHIIAVAKTTGALEELDDRIQAAGGQATLAPMDITVDAAMQQLCRSIFERWGKLDLWIHTAIQAAPLSPTSDLPPKDFEKSLDVNVRAAARLIGFLDPLLRPQGTAVFFDDIHAGAPFYGTYGAHKAAQIAMAKSWQAETVKIGPKVKILSPRPMPTALRARFHPGEDRSTLTPEKQEAARLVAQIL